MKTTFTPLALATLSLSAALLTAVPAQAQVAGASTTVDTSVIESTQVAMGWSVKKTLMGKTIYNDAGLKVGKVDDLIISPDKNLSFVIVGAGGFVGIGRHDVAIPVSRIKMQSGKLVMAGASKDMIKALPEFTYSDSSARREQFMAAAERDLSKGQARLAALEKKAGLAAADAKVGIDVQVSNLRVELNSTEAKLNEMKQASAERWKEFEAGVSAATARLRKAIDAATA